MCTNLAKENIVIVFDLDGTLVDTAKTTNRVLSNMLDARVGNHKPLPPIAHLLSQGGETLIKTALGSFANEINEDLLEFRERLLRVQVPATDVYFGVKQLLQMLKNEGSVLAVCTNKPQRLAEKTLVDVGLRSLFSCIVGSTEPVAKKPDIAMLTNIKEMIGCETSNLIFVGDSEVDQETAHNASVPYIHFSYGYGCLRSDISQPIQIFEEIDETALMYFSRLTPGVVNLI